jgi:hypothetical protein
MNLSLQLGRALFAVALAAVGGACAFAQSDMLSDADASAPSVAHKRLEIATVPQAQQETHWVVASVRVGMPESSTPQSAADAQRVAAHTPSGDDHHG